MAPLLAGTRRVTLLDYPDYSSVGDSALWIGARRAGALNAAVAAGGARTADAALGVPHVISDTAHSKVRGFYETRTASSPLATFRAREEEAVACPDRRASAAATT